MKSNNALNRFIVQKKVHYNKHLRLWEFFFESALLRDKIKKTYLDSMEQAKDIDGGYKDNPSNSW